MTSATEHLEEWGRIRSGQRSTEETRTDELDKNKRRAARFVILLIDEQGGISIADASRHFGYENVKMCLDAGYIADCGKQRPYSCLHVTPEGDELISRKTR